MTITVRVQSEDFDVGRELAALRMARPEVGAVASFVGAVRDRNDGATIGTLTLEHYPGMTERSIEAICRRAGERWPLVDVCVIHRVGPLEPTEQIVLVAVSSGHRGAALDACAFIIDWLKTDAPFWKKESTPEGSRWVEARDSDRASLARWDDTVAPERDAA